MISRFEKDKDSRNEKRVSGNSNTSLEGRGFGFWVLSFGFWVGIEGWERLS